MSAKLSRNKLAESLIDFIEAKGVNSNTAKQIAAYLIDQKRTKELDSLMRDIMRHQAQAGSLEITATSAHELDNEIRAQIKQLLPANKHVINEVVDSSVLGGVLIETADTQLDLTVATKIQKLRSVIS